MKKIFITLMCIVMVVCFMPTVAMAGEGQSGGTSELVPISISSLNADDGTKTYDKDGTNSAHLEYTYYENKFCHGIADLASTLPWVKTVTITGINFGELTDSSSDMIALKNVIMNGRRTDTPDQFKDSIEVKFINCTFNQKTSHLQVYKIMPCNVTKYTFENCKFKQEATDQFAITLNVAETGFDSRAISYEIKNSFINSYGRGINITSGTEKEVLGSHNPSVLIKNNTIKTGTNQKKHVAVQISGDWNSANLTADSKPLITISENNITAYAAVRIHNTLSGKGAEYVAKLVDNTLTAGTRTVVADGDEETTKKIAAHYNAVLGGSISGEYAASITVDGNTAYYGTLADAIAAVSDGETVKLIQDVNYSSAKCFDIGKNFTLDLNGKTITAVSNGSCSGKGATHFIRVNNGGIFTITDTSVSKEGCITATYGASSQLLVVEIMSGGKFTLDAGKIQNAASTNYGSSTVYVREGGTFILDGGTVAAVAAKKRAYPVFNNGIMEMKNGLITSNDSASEGIVQKSTQPLKINGGNINVTHKVSISISQGKAMPVISGGKFSGVLDVKWIAEGKYAVYDGTDSAVVDTAPETYNACINQKLYFTGETGADDAVKVLNAGDTLVLKKSPGNAKTSKSFSSGKFTVMLENGAAFDSSAITVMDGYKVVSATVNESTTDYSVVVDENQAQAQIGDTYFVTLLSANSNAKDGDTITVLADITNQTSTIYTSKDVTIDLNGHLIQGKKNSTSFGPNGSIIKSNGEGKQLTIIDSSEDKSGKVENIGTSGYAVYADKGTVTIKAGDFSGATGAIAASENAGISVTGGTFSTDPTDYLANSNYRVRKNGDNTYTVYYSAPYIPTTPTTPTDNVTNSGSTTTDNASTSADLSGSTSTSNGTTTATVDKTTADKIVDKAVENKSTEVVIDATANTTTAANSTTIAQVTIPTETLGAIAEKTEADVTIKTDVAEVKMDNAAAAAVSEQATGDKVQIVAEKVKEDATEVHFELKVVCSNGTVISDFKGGNVAVTVTLPKEMADKKVVCVYIDDNGHMSKVEGQKNADGTYTFVTGHFSTYAIMAEEEADAAIAAQTEAIKNIEIKLTSKQVKTKSGKKGIKITWTAAAGDKTLDGVEVFRSKEKNKGYGTKAFFTSTKGGNKGSYINTKSLKKGTRYYYKVRGYVLVNGEKVYTDYSTKAWRTVK